MLQELAGFFLGLSGIGIALWMLYRRDLGRLVQGIYDEAGGPQGA